MPKRTAYLMAADRAHGHLLRGFDMAWKKSGEVPLGHQVLDPKTMEARQMTDIALSNNPEGMTSGLPRTSRKAYQLQSDIRKPQGAGQTAKNKAAGIVVDPTAHETFTGTDAVSVDTAGGYGLTPAPL